MQSHEYGYEGSVFPGRRQQDCGRGSCKVRSEDTLRFFEGLGLLTKTRGTLVYPASDQAAAVREALSMELKRLGVEVCTGMTVERAGGGKRVVSAAGFRGGGRRSFPAMP